MSIAKNVITSNWRSLAKPSNYYLEEAGANKGIFTVEPLDKGFGTTLGNSLRRIMLSSLYGAAIVAFKIEGVKHEFSTIDGVKEDVVLIVLALKKVIIKYGGNERRRVKLVATGPGPITAGMIEVPSDIEIINKDFVICNLNKDVSLNIELYITTGRGYKAFNEHNIGDLPVGFILIDAIFSPVKSVNYRVENSRVGSDTELDKLYLDIETNGSISPDLALSLSAKVMQEQLSIFTRTIEEEAEEETSAEDALQFDPRLLKRVDHLEVSVRAQNCLKHDNITYVGDLVIKSEADMLKTPNFGRKSLSELSELLESMGLSFGMDVPGWPPTNIEELAKKYEEK